MANYAKQKRITLDRLTNVAVRETSKIIYLDLEQRRRQIFDDLNRDKGILQDADVKYLRPKFDKVFTGHQFLTVRTAVSDGMQEVTPQNEMGLWQLLPDDADPLVSLTILKPQLGKKRDTIAQEYIKKVSARSAYTLKQLRKTLLDDYLSTLRQGYRSLAGDWLAGESTINDVNAMLAICFGATKSESTRIFRTETTNYFNDARAEYFSENTDMDYMQIFSIADGRRSMICEDRHGWVFPMSQARDSDKLPAFHPHCRTVQRPLTTRLASHRQLIDRGLAMNPASFTPLPKGWGQAS